MRKTRIIFAAVILAAVAARRLITGGSISAEETVIAINSGGVRAALSAMGRFSSPSDVIEAFKNYGEAVEISSVR